MSRSLRLPSVWFALARWWGLSPSEVVAFYRALSRSQWSRPTELRQQIGLVSSGISDPYFFLHRTLRPQVVLEVLELLVKEGVLAAAAARLIGEMVLSHVSRDGTWL
jgi:hypothetical protein